MYVILPPCMWNCSFEMSHTGWELRWSKSGQQDSSAFYQGQQNAAHGRGAHHGYWSIWEGEGNLMAEIKGLVGSVFSAKHRCERCVWWFRSLLAARMAPVMAPLVIEFQGSSLPRTFTKPQSIMENSPPHTAKLPSKHTQTTDFIRTRFPPPWWDKINYISPGGRKLPALQQQTMETICTCLSLHEIAALPYCCIPIGINVRQDSTQVTYWM